MKGFTELLEAKVEKNLTSLYPKAPAEQHFFDLHKVTDDISDNFLEPDNGVFNSGKKVKTFDRSKNRFGRDEVQSIKAYDENVSLEDRIPNAHKKATVRYLLDKDGNVIDSDPNSNSNKQALQNLIKRAVGKRKKLLVVKEEKKKEEFKEGDYVHIGLRTKGGAGFRGKVTSIDEHGRVTIERPKDEGLDKYYPKTHTGHKSLVTKEETQLDEISKNLLNRYVDKASLNHKFNRYANDTLSSSPEDYNPYESSTKLFKKNIDNNLRKRKSGIQLAFNKLNNKALGEDKVEERNMNQIGIESSLKNVAVQKPSIDDSNKSNMFNKKKRGIVTGQSGNGFAKPSVQEDYKTLIIKKLTEAHEESKENKFHKEAEKVEKELHHLEKEANKRRKVEKSKHAKESVNPLADAPIKEWIELYQTSDDPKFEGKSAEKRREMAIAAYAKQKGKA
jgi:hypothetical protein